MNKTKIEWTDYTSNPIKAERISDGKRGHYCTKVSAGRLNCYAERINRRFGTGLDYTAENADKIRFVLDEKELLKILRTRQTAKRIFIGDMTDIFHPKVPFEFVDKIFAVAAMRPDLTFQILTKRPERMLEYFYDIGGTTRRDWVFVAAAELLNVNHLSFPVFPLPNVWLGVSAENQQAADERIPLLLQCPAAIRFVSIEPCLGPADFKQTWPPDSMLCVHCQNVFDVGIGYETYTTADGEEFPICPNCGEDNIGGYPSFAPVDVTPLCDIPFPSVDWVILARPMDPAWARSVRDQCQAAGVPFFFKRGGSGWKRPTPPDLAIREYPDGH
jgi:protein gp37